MYCLTKLYKTTIRAGLIIASKNCITEPLSGVTFKIFKILFKHVENFHNKSTLYSSYKRFWAVENSFLIIEKLNIINTRKRAKTLVTYNFNTLYTIKSNNLLIKVLSEIIHFVFKSKVGSKIGFSATSIYWTLRGLGKRYFTEKSIIETITFLIKSCYFTIRNVLFKQILEFLCVLTLLLSGQSVSLFF